MNLRAPLVILTHMDGLQFFDRKQEFSVAWKTLPHWAQAGTVCFITWRTADSLPAMVQDRITRERCELLTRFGLDPRETWNSQSLGETLPRGRVSPRLASQLAKLSPGDAAKLRWELFNAWDRQLDLGAGECVLARPELSEIVESSLRHFDGQR